MHFPVLAKKFRQPWMKVKYFAATLGCQEWVVMPKNLKKKSKITAP
jgi:hypothetical protein